MFRWSILFGTFALWITCMLLVYLHCRQPAQKNASAAAQSNLEALFADDAEPERGWRVFVDPLKLKNMNMTGSNGQKLALLTVPWNGNDENRLLEIGWMKTTIKKKSSEATRLEQVSDSQFDIPTDVLVQIFPMLRGNAGLPAKLTMTTHSRSDISMDQGLETFDSETSLGLANLRSLSHGVRDGDILNVTTQLFQDQTKLYENHEKIPVGAKDAPSLEMLPFQNNPEIHIGAEWSVSILDTSSLDLANISQSRAKTIKAKCTRRCFVTYEKEKQQVFEARNDENQLRAWYSADGVVIKQTCKLFDTADLMLVRIDPRKLKQFFSKPAPPAEPRQGGSK